MILKEISDDPISDHGSHNVPYNSHVVTVMGFLDYPETCERNEWTPRGIPAFCSVRLTVLTRVHPVFWHFFIATRKTPMCGWHPAAVTNTWYSRLLTIRTWFWLRVLEVLVCGQMAMFALRCAVKQRVVSQDPVTKHLTASDWDVRKEKGRSWVPSTLQEHFANF